MQLLLNDCLAPITSTIGFLELDFEVAARAFHSWHQSFLRADQRVDCRSISGDLPSVLLHLLPLTTVLRRRHLFVPTRSRWTAYFDNGAHGTDAYSPMSYMAQTRGCHGLRVTAVPNTISRDARLGRYGATILEMYGPERTEFLNTIRSVGAVNDGGRWSFDAGGQVQPFEDVAHYQARR